MPMDMELGEISIEDNVEEDEGLFDLLPPELQPVSVAAKINPKHSMAFILFVSPVDPEGEKGDELCRGPESMVWVPFRERYDFGTVSITTVTGWMLALFWRCRPQGLVGIWVTRSVGFPKTLASNRSRGVAEHPAVSRTGLTFLQHGFAKLCLATTPTQRDMEPLCASVQN